MSINLDATGAYFTTYGTQHEISQFVKDALRLSHVSRQWKFATQCMPRLWDDLWVSFGTGSHSTDSDAQRGILASLLQRSHPLPVSLTLKLGDKVPSDFLAILETSAAATRVRTLRLKLSHAQFLVHIPPATRFSMLEGYKDHSPRRIGHQVEHLLNHLQSTNLRGVTLEPLHPEMHLMPWTRLTTLALTLEGNPTILRDIILHCTNVVKVWFCLRTSWENMWNTLLPEIQLTVLPHLGSLTIELDIEEDARDLRYYIAPLLQPFALPVLQEFHISGQDPDCVIHAWDHIDMLHFARSSFPTLANLALYDLGPIDSRELVEIIELCPCLVALTCIGLDLDVYVLCQELTPSFRLPGLPLAPFLENLNVEGLGEFADFLGPDAMDATFLGLLAERWWSGPRSDSSHPVCRMKEVRVSTEREEATDQETINELLKYTQEGLKIEYIDQWYGPNILFTPTS